MTEPTTYPPSRRPPGRASDGSQHHRGGRRGDRRGGRREVSLADMVRGVALLAAGVVVAAWLLGPLRSDTVVRPDPVDYAAVAGEAQPAAPYDLAVPASLPAGWRATSARFDPVEGSWHLGILTEQDEYAGVEQRATGGLVEEVAGEASTAGTVEVAGETWQRLVDEGNGEVTLVRRAGGTTTLVTGSAPEPSLVLLAEALRV